MQALDISEVLQQADQFEFASGKDARSQEVYFTARSTDRKILIHYSMEGQRSVLTRVSYSIKLRASGSDCLAGWAACVSRACYANRHHSGCQPGHGACELSFLERRRSILRKLPCKHHAYERLLGKTRRSRRVASRGS